MVGKNIKGQEKEILNKYDNILDLYLYYMQPISREIGLTLEQFWEDDPELYFAYLEAYNERKKQEFEEKNILAHIQGIYFCLALQQNLQFTKTPKQIYPTKPLDFGLSEKKEISVEESNDAWLAYFNKMLK